MEAEALRDVPGFMEEGKGEGGMLVQVIAPGEKVCETQPPVGHAPSDSVMIPVGIHQQAFPLAGGWKRRRQDE